LYHNYCIIKKFIHQIGNPEVRNRQEQTGTDRNRQEQTGTDRSRQEQTERERNSKKQTGTVRIRQDFISDVENCCILKKFIHRIGNV
jgi:hypothetical protein